MNGWLPVRWVSRSTAVCLVIALAMIAMLTGAGISGAAEAENPSRQQVEALKSQVLANGDAEALKQLEDLSENSTPAMVALGDIYAADGVIPTDGARAAQYYERALDKGDKSVRTRLGVLYRDGDRVPANPERAFELLSAAAQEGDNWAMFHLAQGHLRGQFGKASRPAEGVKLLEQAMAAGNPQAVAALSNLYLWGHGGVRRDPKRAVALLEEAADKGNAVAARNLIAAYRDGRGRLIPRDQQRAAALLDKYAKLFDPASLATEKLLGDSVRTNTAANREALADSFAKGDPAARRRLLLSLRAGNPNAYVSLLQERLKAAGKYTGSVDGRLSRSTIRAINSYCAEQNIGTACRQGPLTVGAATALADALK